MEKAREGLREKDEEDRRSLLKAGIRLRNLSKATEG
jgi:hypothetical protein